MTDSVLIRRQRFYVLKHIHRRPKSCLQTQKSFFPYQRVQDLFIYIYTYIKDQTMIICRCSLNTVAEVWNLVLRWLEVKSKVFHVDTNFLNTGDLSASADRIYLLMYTHRPLCASRHRGHRHSNTQTQMNTSTQETPNHLSILGIQFSPLVSPPLFQMDD